MSSSSISWSANTPSATPQRRPLRMEKSGGLTEFYQQKGISKKGVICHQEQRSTKMGGLANKNLGVNHEKTWYIMVEY